MNLLEIFVQGRFARGPTVNLKGQTGKQKSVKCEHKNDINGSSGFAELRNQESLIRLIRRSLICILMFP